MSASGSSSGLYASKAGGAYGAIPSSEEAACCVSQSLSSTSLHNHSTAPGHIFPDSDGSKRRRGIITSESTLFGEAVAEDEAATALRQAQGHSGVVFNTATALLGASMFSMPWAFSRAGVLGGSVALFVVAYVAYETARVLLMAQRSIFQRTGLILSYPEIASTIFEDDRWASFVRSATIISCIGGCCGYMIFLGQVCQQLLSLSFMTAISGLCVPLILVSWVRSFHELSYFTTLGVAAIVASVFAILISGVMHSDEVLPLDDVLLLVPSETFQFFGVVTFTFTIHYCVLSMGEEVLHKTKHLPQSGPPSTLSTGGLTPPMALAYFASTLCICSLGVFGYIAYRHSDFVRDVDGRVLPGCEGHVCQNIILNISGGWIRTFVGIALVISLSLSYILILVPAREHIERSILKCLPPSAFPEQTTRRVVFENTVRAVIVIGTALVAIHTPYFGSVLGTVGGFTDATQSFVIPPLIFLRLNADKPFVSAARRWFFRAVFTWGVILVTGTTILVLSLLL